MDGQYFCPICLRSYTELPRKGRCPECLAALEEEPHAETELTEEELRKLWNAGPWIKGSEVDMLFREIFRLRRENERLQALVTAAGSGE